MVWTGSYERSQRSRSSRRGSGRRDEARWSGGRRGRTAYVVCEACHAWDYEKSAGQECWRCGSAWNCKAGSHVAIPPAADSSPQSLIDKFLLCMPDSVDKDVAEKLSKALHTVVLGASATAAGAGGPAAPPDAGAQMQAISRASTRLKLAKKRKESLKQKIEQAEAALAKLRKEDAEADESIAKLDGELRGAYGAAMGATPSQSGRTTPASERADESMGTEGTGEPATPTVPATQPPCSPTQPDGGAQAPDHDFLKVLLTTVEGLAADVAATGRARQKKMAEAGFEDADNGRDSSRSPRRESRHPALVKAEEAMRLAQQLADEAKTALGIEERTHCISTPRG